MSGKLWSIFVCFGLLFLEGCASVGPKVQVTLSDGQKVVGYLTTETLTLKSRLGEMAFDANEAGELGLLEGANIEQAGNMIRLWLRNGSEFVGEWQKPSVTVLMQIGGKDQSIEIPITKLKRLQFHGEAIWPSQAVFRIVTQNGDDFFVDVTQTQMTFSNEMGSFSPFLFEIQQLEPMDGENKLWKIYLENQSLFIAKLDQEKLGLRLTMGPKFLEIPLATVTRMNRETLFYPQASSLPNEEDSINLDGFFSNQMQKNAKQESQQRLKK
ncbi:MAG: hypothetical protein AABZ60_03515 [Planctomycetota bacterium]